MIKLLPPVKLKILETSEGAEVIQLYVGYKNSKIDRQVKVLRGFERVELKPGEKQKVKVTSPIERIKWFNPDTNSWELEEMDDEVYIGNSSDNKDLIEGKISLKQA